MRINLKMRDRAVAVALFLVIVLTIMSVCVTLSRHKTPDKKARIVYVSPERNSQDVTDNVTEVS